MLTRLAVRNFKLFDDVEIELGDRVVLVGPNNSGKTSALQAIALWSLGVRRWREKWGDGEVPSRRPGVTINRRDLISLPVPSANLLWRGLRTRSVERANGRQQTRNIRVEIDAEGIADGRVWETRIEFDYSNEESVYCRSRTGPDGRRLPVPKAAADLRIAYLPPMSGLAATELRLDPGAIDVRIGEGRTAEVLRNLCWYALDRGGDQWSFITERMESLFGTRLEEPVYLPERGEIRLAYVDRAGTRLDISASGRGQQQTLLLLAHMAASPGSVLLLDEPDAHLEVLRQRQIYREIAAAAEQTGSQIVAASHSEVMLREAADQDIVVAFVGRPHRIDDRGSQVAKALQEIEFDQYLQAIVSGWVLYVEGSTDAAILQAFAERLGHPARESLARAFVRHVGNQPQLARRNFHALREAKPDLGGIAIYDRLDTPPYEDPSIRQIMWRRREIENYLCERETLLGYAAHCARTQAGGLFEEHWVGVMASVIEEMERALETLGVPSPWGGDVKASSDFMDRVFQRFFERIELPNLMQKTDYHTLVPFVPEAAIDEEVREVLDAIHEVASAASPEGPEG